VPASTLYNVHFKPSFARFNTSGNVPVNILSETSIILIDGGITGN